MTNQDQTSLLARLRSADALAVEQWYHCYEPVIRRYVAGRVDSPADIDELVQEIFISCLRSLPSFAGQSHLKTWMLAISRHEVNDFYRKRYAKKVLQLLPLSDWLLGDFLDEDKYFSATGTTNDLRETLEHVFQQTGSYYRELLLEKYLDNLSVADLALRRGKTAKAIESELFRARRAFKKAYQELTSK